MTASTRSVSVIDPAMQNRALLYCVVASLLLHLIALLIVPGFRSGAPSPPASRVITATFASRAAAPVAPERETARPAPPSKPLPRPVQDAPRPVVSAPSSPAPVRAPEVPVASPAPAQPSAPPASTVPTAAAPAASAPPSGPVPGSARARESPAPAASAGEANVRQGSDGDAGSLDQYRVALIVSARRYKRYPAQAMDRGWQGKVEVRLVIGANGMIQSSAIKSSSGHEILDNQALDMVKKAKPLTPIPAALRGKEFVVDVPVIFDLQAG